MKFIQLMNDIGEKDFFNLVNVSKVAGKYPALVNKYNIKEVPTAIIDGEIYVGPQAFKWLEKKIKNLNHQVSSQNTRANKTPVISGYVADITSAPLEEGGSVEGNSSFASIFSQQKIDTPDADAEYEKTPFILPSDNITGGNIIKDDRPDKTSRMDNDLEKMMAERERDNPRKRM